jgi:tetratricopeptide (TPR) repeat protein
VTRAGILICWHGDLAPLRAALAALTPGSGAYSGSARGFWISAWYARDFAAAVRVAEAEQSEAWSDSANVALPRRLYLAWAREAAGDKDKARADYVAVEQSVSAALAKRQDDAEMHLAAGLAAAGLGQRDRALQEGRRALELLPPSRDMLSGSSVLLWVAQIEARAGARDAAIDRLRDVLGLPSGVVVSAAILRLDPVWDSIRADERFVRLLGAGDSLVQEPPKR